MPLLSRNVALSPALRLGSRRKVAIGTWGRPGDPSVYGVVDLDAAKVLDYIEKLRATSGQRITITHFVGKAVALTIAKYPAINCVLRFGKLYPRKSIDVCFLVAADKKGADLSGMIIREADKKSLPDHVKEMEAAVDDIREKGDPAFRQVKKTLGGLPGFLSKYLILFTEFLTYVFNLWSPLLGTPRDPFGSVIITNIGSLGLDMAFAPLLPYSRCPLLITLGAVRETPVVKDGQIVIAKMLRLMVTFDHRLVDGVHMSHMASEVARIFENPEALLGSNG